MVTLLVDTHEVVKTLVNKDFSEKQAEGVVEAIQDIDLSNLATKADLRVAIADLKADLFKWVIPILLGQAAFIVALIKWLS